METMAPQTRLRDAGFSLLELIVVLALSALIATAALVSRGTAAPNLRTLALQLATELNAAREVAIASDRPVRVWIDAGGGGYRAESRRSAVLLPSPVRIEYDPAHHLGHGGTQPNVAFYSDGSSTGGRLKLSDGANAIALRIDYLSGAVAVEGAAR